MLTIDDALAGITSATYRRWIEHDTPNGNWSRRRFQETVTTLNRNQIRYVVNKKHPSEKRRHPTRSAHDTGFIRASHALSHHERSQMSPAPPQSLKMLYSEPGEACGHVRASESTPPHRRKAPRQWQNTTNRALTESDRQP